LSDLKVHAFGNVAVVTGRSSMNGEDVSGKYCFTDTWVKQGGKWKLVAAHIGKAE
jgi:ketosteroid isomerase-like protein